MKKYYPQRMELGPRDKVARANYNEIISMVRGTEHRGVWLDVTHLPKKKSKIDCPPCMNNLKN